MKLKEWNKLTKTNKRVYLLLSRELLDLSLKTNTKYKVVLLNG